MDWATFLAALVGCDVTNPAYKPYWYTLLPAVVILDILVFGIYTIHYYVESEDYMKCLQVLCIAGVVVPVIFK